MADFFKKAMGFIGLPIEEDGEEKKEENVEESEFELTQGRKEKDGKESGFSIGSRKNKVISVHTTTQLKVVVRTPNSFENARDIVDHLRAKKPVVVNLENVDIPIAKRIVDFTALA